MSKKANTPPPATDPVDVEDNQLSSAQEAVPVPMLLGERKISLKWISRVYNTHAVEAPAERPAGKK